MSRERKHAVSVRYPLPDSTVIIEDLSYTQVRLRSVGAVFILQFESTVGIKACPHQKTAKNCCRNYSRRKRQQNCQKRQHCCLKRQLCCPKRRHFSAVFGDCSRPKQQQIVAEDIVAENGNIVAGNGIAGKGNKVAGNCDFVAVSGNNLLLVWTGHNNALNKSVLIASLFRMLFH